MHNHAHDMCNQDRFVVFDRVLVYLYCGSGAFSEVSSEHLKLITMPTEVYYGYSKRGRFSLDHRRQTHVRIVPRSAILYSIAQCAMYTIEQYWNTPALVLFARSGDTTCRLYLNSN